jgi:formylglycine-generating enzyme required for sulfatase activity
MQFPFTTLALSTAVIVFACTPAMEEDSAVQPNAAISIDVLKDRSTYSTLTEAEVEALVPAVQSRWPEEFSGFSYLGTERFSAGGASHWMSIWSHGGTGLEFVLVPGGSFQMGSPKDEVDRRDDELQHQVSLHPFLIARTECTQGAWSKFASAAGLAGETFEGSAQLPISGFNPADSMLCAAPARLQLGRWVRRRATWCGSQALAARNALSLGSRWASPSRGTTATQPSLPR